ncbi:hypothetical protein ARALYDRAFT_476146 [Arabidopsis lyrata subsp. lyrata]|uniref:AD domain-containing protein n=1 Tax=Arabidopsis lyrata subsp. lyrata TaxID=81972 RepID=D7KXZ5_ARALL|nr:hypothetical protein ARALYDRAFT_476146 [Arabidopsis lyrata subsp. lyrata]
MKPASATVAKHDGEREDEKFAVGTVYAVKLITGDEFNGIVLAYDSAPNFAIFDILFRNQYSNVEKIGFGVTSEAQKIFDAISKTLPIRWDSKDMLVMGEVIVRSPYHSDCVFGGTRAVNDRVKTVLEQVRKKLQLSDT